MQGLSILIPVYNYAVEELVKVLSSQLISIGKPAEIIILDDASNQVFQTRNQQLTRLPSVVYSQNDVNQGRMETRNRLAFLATYNNILFIDADSKVDHPDFLAKYFAEISRGTQLVTGGRIYSKEKPACEYMLHWKYGSTRENYNTGQPAFMSNNFLVRKDLFQQLSKTTRLEGYGHEDSWWGIQFEKMGAHIKTIDNPVIHASLSTNENFLQKSEQALVNLLLLAKHEDQTLLIKHIRIYRVFKKLQSSGLKHIFLFLERIMNKQIRKNLLSCNPSLRYFDWYRLAKLFSLAKNQPGH